MADFIVEGGFDARAILEGFKKLTDAGTKAGREVGAGFEDQLNRFGKRSVASLQQELGKLQSRQLRVNVDSTAFAKTGEKIKEIQALIDQANKKKLSLQFDPASINGLTNRLKELQTKSLDLKVGTDEYRRAQLQVDALQRRIQNLGRTPVAAGSLEALNRQLQDLQQRQTRLRVDSTAFARTETQIQEVQKRIDAVGRQRLLINADPSSIVAMRTRLQEVQAQLERVKVGSTAFKELSTQARAAEASLNRATGAAQGLSKAGSGIGANITSQLAGLASIAGIVALFKGAVDQAVQLETITRKLSNTLGPQGAAGALSFTKGLANQLGLSYTTLSNTFGGFTAAASAAGVPMETQRQLFAAVAKSAQSLGLSNEELGGSLLALQQTASKGVVSMEELRGQLGERLPIAFGATAKGLGVTQQQLIKLVESGKLTAAEFFPALTKGLNELTAGAGGVATAAQNFEKLGNAWTELQGSFGTNLLPGVVEQVKNLAGALEGIGVSQRASELGVGSRLGLIGKALGDVPVLGAQAVGALRAVETQFGLTGQEGADVFARAAREVGATRDAMGQFNLTSEQAEKILSKLPALAKAFRDANPDADAKKRAEAAAVEALGKKLQQALDIDKARASAVAELINLRAQEPVRRLDDQLAVGQQLNTLAGAAGALEQARFDVIRARVQYEIDNAQRLGITQEGIGARAAQQAELQRQAVIAKYQSLLLQQKVEEALLALSQKRATADAQAAVIAAQQAFARAQLAVVEAQADGDGTKIGLAIEAARLAAEQIPLAQQRLDLLAKIAPIEAAIGKATAETARQQLLAVGAGLGIEQQLRNIDTGAAQASEQVSGIVTAFKDASGAITVLSKPLPKEVQDSYGKISENIVTLGKAIDPAQKNAKEFAKAMKGSADNAERLTAALTQAANTKPPAPPAPVRSFVNSSGEIVITNTRFTGGAVVGGMSYRINDGPGGRSLGQESFLSAAGGLGLINRPLNSMWTAPSAGIVLPAALTTQLKGRGAFDARGVGGGGGSASRVAAVTGALRPDGASTAHLELAITDLAAEVQALRRKQWTVQQRVTNSAGTSQIRTMNAIL